jgi:hypothetical protein
MVTAVSSRTFPFPARKFGMRILYMQRRTTKSSSSNSPQHTIWSSQRRPRSPVAIPMMSRTSTEGCLGPTGLHSGANFAGAKDATASDAAGADKPATTALSFGQGASHRTQGPGSLPSFLAEQSPQIQAMILEGGMSFCCFCVWFVCCLCVVCTTMSCSM